MGKNIAANHIRLKRAYEPPASDDDTWVLIDRLWPRGVKKANAAIGEWMKEIAPSTELRKWFGHDPERWPEFRRRYKSEVREHAEQFNRLRNLAQQGRITLVFSGCRQWLGADWHAGRRRNCLAERYDARLRRKFPNV